MSKVVDWEEVLDFWLVEVPVEKRFVQDDEVDALIWERFGETREAGARNELWGWRGEARGRVAEVIVLDQFSRNMYRGLGEAFATDSLSLCVSQETVRLGLDEGLEHEERHFLYLPYMHSESLKVHEEALRLFGALGALEYEEKHLGVLRRFGRYPSRNEALGRESTAEELEFLEGGSGW